MDDAQWRGLRRAVGEPVWASGTRFGTLAGRLAAHDEIDRELSAWTRQRTNDEVMRWLQAEGVAAAAVLNAAEVAVDPQINALG